jgi:hypothetical protein
MFHVKHKHHCVAFANNKAVCIHYETFLERDKKLAQMSFLKNGKMQLNSQAKPFFIGFFEMFGITNKCVGTFKYSVNLVK